MRVDSRWHLGWVYKTTEMLHAARRDAEGEAIAKKTTELLTTGKLGYYEDLKAEFPEGITTLLEIPGIVVATPARGDDAARMLRGASELSESLQDKLAAASVTDIGEAIHWIQRISNICRQTAQAGDLVLDMERKLLGDSDAIPDDAEMTLEEAVDEIRGASDALQRAEAAGLKVIEGGAPVAWPDQSAPPKGGDVGHGTRFQAAPGGGDPTGAVVIPDGDPEPAPVDDAADDDDDQQPPAPADNGEPVPDGDDPGAW